MALRIMGGLTPSLRLIAMLDSPPALDRATSSQLLSSHLERRARAGRAAATASVFRACCSAAFIFQRPTPKCTMSLGILQPVTTRLAATTAANRTGHGSGGLGI